jgi:PilZ domain
MRHRNDLRGQNNERIDYHRPGFLIPEPDAAWVECFILDVSEGGIRLDVGALGAVPEIFGVAFNSDGKVIRLCQIAWRRAERIDARFLTARQLRQRQRGYRDPRLQKLLAPLNTPSS